MKSIKMSYRGVCFEVNPSTLKTEYSKRTAVTEAPGSNAGCKEVCELPVKVSGKGILAGENASARAQQLLAAFKKKGSAYLFLPVVSPFKALFTSLELNVCSERNCIGYSFEFVQDISSKSGEYDFGYTLAQDGENLFDIAYRTNTAIETVIALNDFEEPFSVKEGDKVWLK
ncbi:MAG: DNA circularization N-terminal domain-containing protein [Eubacterium sp.]|nr:DNA circularization N-terminal domain-containing protein [Eubacterium sp.]